MSRPSWLQKIYWTRFAKPAQERELFRQLIERPFRSVLEIGVGNAQRMRRIARLIQQPSGTALLRYIGTDEFESAQDRKSHITLKQAHQIASQLGFKVSLIPGDVASAVPRVAHKLGASDLLVINGGLNPLNPQVGLIGGWLNRLAHQDSVILASEMADGELQLVDAKLLELPIRVAA